MLLQKKWFWLWAPAIPTEGAERSPTNVDVEWLSDNGWGIVMCPRYVNMQSGPSEDIGLNFDQNTENAFEICTTFNVPVRILLNDIFYSQEYAVEGPYGLDPLFTDLTEARRLCAETNWNGTSRSYLENKYGDLFRYIEGRWGGNTGVLKGYWQESACDAQAAWLHTVTDLDITQGIYHRMWQAAGTDQGSGLIGSSTNEPQLDAVNRRMAIVDGVDIELWHFDDIMVYDLQGCAAWIRENWPDIPIGCNSVSSNGPISGPDAVTGGAKMWTYHIPGYILPEVEAPPPFEVQRSRFFQSVNTVKAAIGAFDIIDTQTSASNETELLWDGPCSWAPQCHITSPTWWEWQKSEMILWDSLNLDAAGTKYAWMSAQEGIIPYYSGAGSYCFHDPLPDTFANTGNELILLKNYGAASTHDITVTSSLDPLVNSLYSLALSPERGTFIGPYPLDDYGALPTITYDNTNLYVSVLKVESYSEQS